MNVKSLLPFSIKELQRRLKRRNYDRLRRIVIGADHCTDKTAIAIESATNGAIHRSMLRPDLWPPDMWPPDMWPPEPKPADAPQPSGTQPPQEQKDAQETA